LGVLAALYRAGSRWRVGFDGADWWSRRMGCYPIGDEPRSLLLVFCYEDAFEASEMLSCIGFIIKLLREK
jgi:hypothetical protein